MSQQSLIIGLTGNIATGKSTVLAYLGRMGAHIVDADKLAHAAMAVDGEAYQAIVDEFGPGILNPDGAINRHALGRIVFADARTLGRLERIVHPAVFVLLRQEIEASSSPLVVVEAVKLLEAGPMVSLCDEIWVVTADPVVQLQRLMGMREMDLVQAKQRMQMQSPQAAKVNQADRVIDNSGTLDELHAQLDRTWQDLKQRYPRRMGILAV